MLLHANWVFSKVNNLDGFGLSFENSAKYSKMQNGIIKSVMLYYTLDAELGIVPHGGFVYFKCRNVIDGVEPFHFATLDEFYDLIRESAATGVYHDGITVRHLNQFTFETCGEIKLTPPVLDAMFSDFGARLNDAATIVCEATPLLK